MPARAQAAPAAVPATFAATVPAEFQLPAPMLGNLFFEDFDLKANDAASAAPAEAEPPAPPSFSEAELVAACDACRAEGVQLGLEQARAERAEATRGSLQAIAAGLADAAAAATQAAEAHAGEAARLLLTTVGRLLPRLGARFGAAEAAAMAAALQPALRHQPAATVRVHPDSVAALQAALDDLDPELRERLHLTPAAALAPGDARIEWQDGAAVRDAAALWRSVATVLAPLDLVAPDAAPPSPSTRELLAAE